jgi:putative ABC transport system permease protein
MLRSFLKTAIRNMVRNRIYSLINITGLAVGMASCLLIALYVYHELSFDLFHEKADQIYRVTFSRNDFKGDREHGGATQAPLAAALKTEFPGITQAVRLRGGWGTIQTENTSITERIVFADPSLFDVFTLPLAAGDPFAFATEANPVLLSQAAARKYFGNKNALGEQLLIRLHEDFEPFTVAGILSQVPENSSIQFDFLIPFAKANYGEEWGKIGITTFVLLENKAIAADRAAKFPVIAMKYLSEVERSMFVEREIAFGLQPLRDIHLGNALGYSSGLQGISSPTASYILSGVALLILMIGCINFMNLTVGKSLTRIREVGVRKAIGARRRHLLLQFWVETFFVIIVAVFLGLSLAGFLLPFFNTFVEKDLSFVAAGFIRTVAACIFLAVLAGIIAGMYPALVMSGFRPASVLKGKLQIKGSSRFKNGLIVFQFGLSIALISCTLVITDQIDFMLVKDLGYDDKNLISIPVAGPNGEDLLETYRAELASHAEVTNVAGSDAGMTNTPVQIGLVEFKANLSRVDQHFLQTFEIKLKEGRNFSLDFPSDRTGAVLVNEAFVEQAGLEHPIGQFINLDHTGNKSSEIIGIIKDYHYQSMRQEVEAMILHMGPDQPIGTIWVRIADKNIPGTLALLEEAWHRVAPQRPFSFSFLEGTNALQYRTEAKWREILVYASVLVIAIACLGLFGLAVFATEARTREIGIRKVLGASVIGVVHLLSKDFVKLVLFANLIAWPVAAYFVNQWLLNCAYHIDLNWMTFAAAGCMALVIALLTISTQAIRTALANPVEALRYE